MIRRREKNRLDFEEAKAARAESEKIKLARPPKRKPGRPRKVKHE